MIEKGAIIGDGNFRVCYALKNSDLSIKINRKWVVKKIAGLKIPFPACIFALLKFGTLNPNKKEYHIIQNLPAALKTYLPKHTEIKDGNLMQSRPKDYNGDYSSTVIKYGKVDNDVFWNHVHTIENIFIKYQFFPLDIFRGGGNVIIEKISETEWKPIIIDIKRVGYRPFVDSLDFKLIFKSAQQKKFLQRMKDFKLKYKS